MTYAHILLLSLALLLSACGAAQAASAPILTPASPAIGRFVEQTDAQYAYRRLVPETWEAVGAGDRRLYRSPGPAEAPERLTLSVTNLKIAGEAAKAAGGMLAQYAAFERSPTLEGWTGTIERTWGSLGLTFEALDANVPTAIVYRLVSPGSPDLRLIAYTIDQDIPFAIELTATGSYADLSSLQQEGVYADFIEMLRSLKAVPAGK